MNVLGRLTLAMLLTDMDCDLRYLENKDKDSYCKRLLWGLPKTPSWHCFKMQSAVSSSGK